MSTTDDCKKRGWDWNSTVEKNGHLYKRYISHIVLETEIYPKRIKKFVPVEEFTGKGIYMGEIIGIIGCDLDGTYTEEPEKEIISYAYGRGKWDKERKVWDTVLISIGSGGGFGWKPLNKVG